MSLFLTVYFEQLGDSAPRRQNPGQSFRFWHERVVALVFPAAVPG